MLVNLLGLAFGVGLVRLLVDGDGTGYGHQYVSYKSNCREHDELDDVSLLLLLWY